MGKKDDRIAELDAECDRAHEEIVRLEARNAHLEYRIHVANSVRPTFQLPSPDFGATLRSWSRRSGLKRWDATYRGTHTATGLFRSTAMRKAKRAAKRYDRVHAGRVSSCGSAG